MLLGVFILSDLNNLPLETPVMQSRLIIACILTVQIIVGALGAQPVKNPNPKDLPDNPKEKKDRKEKDNNTDDHLILGTHHDTDSLMLGANIQMNNNDHAGAFRRYEFGLTNAEGRMFQIQPNLYYDVFRHCRTQILRIPPERYGPTATEKQALAHQLFRQAKQNMDQQALKKISQLLFWTSIGDEAIELLADIHMETGRTNEALPLYFRLLNEHRLSPESRIRVTRKTASALIEKNNVRELKPLLENLDADTPISDGTRVITAAGILDNIKKSVAQQDTDGWNTPMGNVHRTGFAVKAPSVDVPKWSYRFDPWMGKKQKESEINYRPIRINYPTETRLDKLFRQLNLSCPYFPPISRNRVVFVEGHFITALNLETGNVAWRVGHPFGTPKANRTAAYRRFMNARIRRSGGWAGLKVNRKISNAMTVNGNILYAFRPDVNGYELEIIDILTGKRLGGTSARDESTKDLPRIMGFGGMAYDKGYLYISLMGTLPKKSHLMGTLPKKPQRVGKRKKPKAAGGLIHMYEKLVCLDVSNHRDLRMVWRKNIYSRTRDMSQNPRNNGDREKTEALHPPTLGDGAVFYNSDEGTIAALESTTGEIRWISTYNKRPTIQRIVRPKESDGIPQSFNPTPVYADKTVYCMPGGINNIIALDSKTGGTRWTHPRDGLNYILGLRDGVLYLSGSKVEALDTKTGKTLWTINPGDMVPAGKGCMAGNLLLVPVRKFRGKGFEDEVLRIDIVTKKLIAPIHMDSSSGEMGNLVVSQGKLLTVNSKQVNVFEPRQQHQTRLERKLDKNPDDPQTLYQLGIMKARLKENVPALEHLEKALKEVTDKHRYNGKSLRDEITDRLYHISMSETRRLATNDDFSQALKMLQQALKHAKTTDQIVTVILARAGALEKLAKTGQAVAEYQRCLDRYPHEELTDDDFKIVSVTDFACRQIKRLIGTHGKTVYRLPEEMAGKLLARGKPENLQTIVNKYRFASVRPQALGKLAEGAKRVGNFSEAALYLKRLSLDYPDGPRATSAIKEAVDLYQQGKYHYNGWQLLQTIRNRMPGEKGFVQTKGKQAIYARAQNQSIKPFTWIDYPLTRLWQATEQRTKSRYRPNSKFFTIGNKTFVIRTTHNPDTLKAFDLDTGRLMWESSDYISLLGTGDRTDVGLAFNKNGIHRIDLLTGKSIWKLSTPQIPGFEQFLPLIDKNYINLAINNNRLVLTFMEAKPPMFEAPSNKLLLVGMDLNSGKVLWHHIQEHARNYRSTENRLFLFDGECAILTATTKHIQLKSGKTRVILKIIQKRLQILNVETGKALFDEKIPELKGTGIRTIQLDNRHLAFTVSNQKSQNLILYDLTQRKIIWKVPCAAKQMTSIVKLQRSGDLLLVVTKKEINAFDINTGKRQGNFNCKNKQIGKLTTDADSIFFYARNDHGVAKSQAVHCMDMSKGQKSWTLELPAEFCGGKIGQSDRYLYSIWTKGYMGSGDLSRQFLGTTAYLVCIDKQSGKLLYKTHLAEFAPVGEYALRNIAPMDLIDGHIGIELRGSFLLMKSE